jgi:hypothetical protein
MMTVFEVHLAEGSDGAGLLSDEVLRETGAQVMTLQEAALVGFQGLQALDGSGDVRLIAVRARDAAWIHRCLETHAAVAAFRAHQVD